MGHYTTLVPDSPIVAGIMARLLSAHEDADHGDEQFRAWEANDAASRHGFDPQRCAQLIARANSDAIEDGDVDVGDMAEQLAAAAHTIELQQIVIAMLESMREEAPSTIETLNRRMSEVVPEIEMLRPENQRLRDKVVALQQAIRQTVDIALNCKPGIPIDRYERDTYRGRLGELRKLAEGEP